MTVKLLALALLLPGAVLQAQTPRRYDILITELLPDPAPAIGLPGSEFVELKNASADTINLRGWILSDGTAAATIKEGLDLPPGHFVIICPNAAVAAYSSWGTTIGVSNFPSLNNEGDTITLYEPGGTVVHAVAYTDRWYQNTIKAGGGWTLEMIDARHPCGGVDNWKAATHDQGGTPGSTNSVAGSRPDAMPPALLSTYAIDSLTIVARFDESLDSSLASSPQYYSFDQGAGHPRSVIPRAPLFSEVILKLATPLQSGRVYQLTASALTDCSGNAIGSRNTAKAGLPAPPAAQALIINELLFNPPPGGSDFIELYNRSDKIVDLKQVYLASRSATGGLTDIQQLSAIPRLLFPGEYVVLTADARWLQQQFPVKDLLSILELPSLPSLPDERGIVVVVNAGEEVVEELQYDRKWHFALLANEEGVSLERIDYSKPAQDSHNWLSAAATAGFGTPGYQNSQFRTDLQAQGTITIAPSLFSPDNDAIDDFVNIQYLVAEPGYVANITIFDAAGMPVRQLTRSTTLGRQGTLRWDGLDNNRRQLPLGIYVIYTELFNLQGKTKKFRNSVTLMRRF